MTSQEQEQVEQIDVENTVDLYDRMKKRYGAEYPPEVISQMVVAVTIEYHAAILKAGIEQLEGKISALSK